MKPNPNCINGTVFKRIELDGLTLTETGYEQDLRLPTHWHCDQYLCFVLAGSFTETYGNGSTSLKKSDFILRPPSEPHANSFDRPTRCFNVKIRKSWQTQMPEVGSARVSRNIFAFDVRNNLPMKLYREFLHYDNFSEMVINGLLLEIMGIIGRQNSDSSAGTPPRWLIRTQDYIRDLFPSRPTLSELSQEAGVHQTHLSREFRRHFGLTIGEFVRHLRIEQACNRLSDTDIPLIDIALSSGFFDQSHFARAFKAFAGMSPLEYRRDRQMR